MVEKSQNRRHFGRRTAFKAATIAQGGQRMAATVLDISEAGARIKTAKPELVEKEFYLEIGADDFVIKCRTLHIQRNIRWRQVHRVAEAIVVAKQNSGKLELSRGKFTIYK